MIYETGYISLIIQFLTGAIDVWGLNIKVPDDKKIFRDLLKVELGVQSVEFIFYSWMVYNFDKIDNITPYRYIDWSVTTPTMLLTLLAFLDDGEKKNLIDYINDNKDFIMQIVVLNLIMLLFGFLAEINQINYNIGIILGCIPFIYYFKLIYDKYLNKKISRDKKNIFWFFLIIWSLYGVVAFLPYQQKNAAYNILDLFSKNCFGLFLVYTLWKNRIVK
jgi:bacteriorhodopsin